MAIIYLVITRIHIFRLNDLEVKLLNWSHSPKGQQITSVDILCFAMILSLNNGKSSLLCVFVCFCVWWFCSVYLGSFEVLCFFWNSCGCGSLFSQLIKCSRCYAYAEHGVSKILSFWSSWYTLKLFQLLNKSSFFSLFLDKNMCLFLESLSFTVCGCHFGLR